MQLINASVTSWKKSIKEEKANLIKQSIYYHHLIENNQIFSLDKLSSRDLYNMQITKSNEKPTSQFYYDSFFCKTNLDRRKIYLLLCKNSINMIFVNLFYFFFFFQFYQYYLMLSLIVRWFYLRVFTADLFQHGNEKFQFNFE